MWCDKASSGVSRLEHRYSCPLRGSFQLEAVPSFFNAPHPLMGTLFAVAATTSNFRTKRLGATPSCTGPSAKPIDPPQLRAGAASGGPHSSHGRPESLPSRTTGASLLWTRLPLGELTASTSASPLSGSDQLSQRDQSPLFCRRDLLSRGPHRSNTAYRATIRNSRTGGPQLATDITLARRNRSARSHRLREDPRAGTCAIGRLKDPLGF